MKWLIQASRFVEVEADATVEALELARKRVEDAGFDVFEVVSNAGERAVLFPEYSREFLEKLYSDQSAALELAVRDRFHADVSDNLIAAATLDVIERSREKAARVLSRRALMNVEGTKQ